MRLRWALTICFGLPACGDIQPNLATGLKSAIVLIYGTDELAKRRVAYCVTLHDFPVEREAAVRAKWGAADPASLATGYAEGVLCPLSSLKMTCYKAKHTDGFTYTWDAFGYNFVRQEPGLSPEITLERVRLELASYKATCCEGGGRYAAQDEVGGVDSCNKPT